MIRKLTVILAITFMASAYLLGTFAAPVAAAPPGPPPGGGGGGGEDVVTVNCNDGDSIQEALDNGADTVNFFGICVEDVSIDRDDITLAGVSPDDHTLSTVQGSVTVTGAQRVVIENATITNPNTNSDFPRYGISVRRGAAARLRNLTITGNQREGVIVTRGSSASLNDMTVTDNRHGVLVNRGSSASLEDMMITNNNRDGIRVRRNSTATLDNLTITGNSNDGVTLSRGAWVGIVNNTMITDNDGGLTLFNGSYVTVNDSTITDVTLLDGSGGRIENSSIGPSPLSSRVISMDSSNLRLSDVAVAGDVRLRNHARLEGHGDVFATSTKITGNVQLSRGSLLTTKFDTENPFIVTGNVTCSTSQSGLGVISGDLLAGGFNDSKGLDILGTVGAFCTLME